MEPTRKAIQGIAANGARSNGRPAWRLRAELLALCLLLPALAAARPALATVFYARDEMLSLAFPDADRVEAHDFFLTAEQHERIESLAHARVDSKLLTVYEGRRDGVLLGYAVLDTHTVRTLPESFLIVLTAEGKVAATHVLAFYEPLEYLPSARWLKQMNGRRLENDLRIGRSIAAISGSTLSSQAVVAAVRRALSVYEVLLAHRP